MGGLKKVFKCRNKHEIRMPFDKRRFPLISFHSWNFVKKFWVLIFRYLLAVKLRTFFNFLIQCNIWDENIIARTQAKQQIVKISAKLYGTFGITVVLTFFQISSEIGWNWKTKCQGWTFIYKMFKYTVVVVG